MTARGDRHAPLPSRLAVTRAAPTGQPVSRPAVEEERLTLSSTTPSRPERRRARPRRPRRSATRSARRRRDRAVGEIDPIPPGDLEAHVEHARPAGAEHPGVLGGQRVPRAHEHRHAGDRWEHDVDVLVHHVAVGGADRIVDEPRGRRQPDTRRRVELHPQRRCRRAGGVERRRQRGVRDGDRAGLRKRSAASSSERTVDTNRSLARIDTRAVASAVSAGMSVW